MASLCIYELKQVKTNSGKGINLSGHSASRKMNKILNYVCFGALYICHIQNQKMFLKSAKNVWIYYCTNLVKQNIAYYKYLVFFFFYRKVVWNKIILQNFHYTILSISTTVLLPKNTLFQNMLKIGSERRNFIYYS